MDSLSLVVFDLGVVFAGSLAVLTTASGLSSAVTLGRAVVILSERPDRIQWVGCGPIFLGVLRLASG